MDFLRKEAKILLILDPEKTTFSRLDSTFFAPSYLLLDHAVHGMFSGFQNLICVRNMSCCIMQIRKIRRLCVSCLY